MQVFQGKREQEILERIKSESPDDLAEGAGQLFTCIMDISKCLQQRILSDAPVPHFESPKTQPVRIACPGTKGSNTERRGAQPGAAPLVSRHHFGRDLSKGRLLLPV